MELQEQVTALQAAIEAGKLTDRDRVFALDLCASYRRRGLSEKQAFWVGKLLSRANGTDKPATKTVASFAGVYALFAKAREHLKYPKITLLLPGNRAIKLYVSTARSRVPDTVNIVEADGIGADRLWYGRVAQDGTFTPSASAAPVADELASLLSRLASAPEEVAAEYGKLTGNCCFCRLPLTDERSTAVGYGPVCASHYGLAWGGKDETPVEVKVAAGVPMQRRIRARRAA